MTIDWLYNYSDDFNHYRKEHQRVLNFLEDTKGEHYSTRIKLLEQLNFPNKETSVSWVYNRIQQEASMIEIAQHMRDLAQEIKHAHMSNHVDLQTYE